MERKQRMVVPSNTKEASISATVIRCGCGDPLTIHPDAPCPTPRGIEERGVVSYYHKNPFRRLIWEIKRAWREGQNRDV